MPMTQTDTVARARAIVAPLDTPAARRMVVAADDLIARNMVPGRCSHHTDYPSDGDFCRGVGLCATAFDTVASVANVTREERDQLFAAMRLSTSKGT